jgi:hypothetical protein
MGYECEQDWCGPVSAVLQRLEGLLSLSVLRPVRDDASCE